MGSFGLFCCDFKFVMLFCCRAVALLVCWWGSLVCVAWHPRVCVAWLVCVSFVPGCRFNAIEQAPSFFRTSMILLSLEEIPCSIQNWIWQFGLDPFMHRVLFVQRVVSGTYLKNSRIGRRAHWPGLPNLFWTMGEGCGLWERLRQVAFVSPEPEKPMNRS